MHRTVLLDGRTAGRRRASRSSGPRRCSTAFQSRPPRTSARGRSSCASACAATGARGSVRALLPSTEGGQVIFDERSSSDRLQFSIRERAGNRIGVWTGWLEDVHEVVYQFRVQSHAVTTPLPGAGPLPEAAAPAAQRLGGSRLLGFRRTRRPWPSCIESLELPAATDQPRAHPHAVLVREPRGRDGAVGGRRRAAHARAARGQRRRARSGCS